MAATMATREYHHFHRDFSVNSIPAIINIANKRKGEDGRGVRENRLDTARFLYADIVLITVAQQPHQRYHRYDKLPVRRLNLLACRSGALILVLFQHQVLP